MAKKNIQVISSDNKLVNNKVKKEPLKVDKRFVKTTKVKTPQLQGKDYSVLTRNGRVYKKLDNQYGIYADNGEMFHL